MTVLNKCIAVPVLPPMSRDNAIKIASCVNQGKEQEAVQALMSATGLALDKAQSTVASLFYHKSSGAKTV